jgi:hypothetical protein
MGFEISLYEANGALKRDIEIVMGERVGHHNLR